MNRVEGQIWIGRDQPNVLKYNANGKEYWATAATTYIASTAIHKGQLLVIDKDQATGNYVKPAVWPRDAEKVVGIALNDAASSSSIRTTNFGYVELDEQQLENLFVTGSDLYAKEALTGANYYSSFGATADGGEGNGWSSVGQGVGAKVYWFSGRTLKTASGYSWQDPSAFVGKLTFATPSGYKPSDTEIPWADDSLNVSYKQLPIIGTVADYEVDGSNKLISLVIHVNFSSFNRKVQFEYPASGLSHYDPSLGAETAILRHGLFPNITASNVAVPHVDIKGWGYTDNVVESATAGESFQVQPGYDSFIGSAADKRTEVEIVSDSEFYYKAVGEVNYNF